MDKFEIVSYISARSGMSVRIKRHRLDFAGYALLPHIQDNISDIRYRATIQRYQRHTVEIRHKRCLTITYTRKVSAGLDSVHIRYKETRRHQCTVWSIRFDGLFKGSRHRFCQNIWQSSKIYESIVNLNMPIILDISVLSHIGTVQAECF